MGFARGCGRLRHHLGRWGWSPAGNAAGFNATDGVRGGMGQETWKNAPKNGGMAAW